MIGSPHSVMPSQQQDPGIGLEAPPKLHFFVCKRDVVTVGDWLESKWNMSKELTHAKYAWRTI